MGEIHQRRDERTAVDWIAVIRLPDGTEIPCTVRDVSSKGMKVVVPAGQDLPESLTLKVIGRDLVFRVRVAWRREHSVGVLIEKIAKLPKPPEAVPVAPSPVAPSPVVDRAGHTRLGSRERFRSGG